jgi:hypothetical protein
MKTGNLTLIVCGIILIIYRVILKFTLIKREKSLHRKTEINYGQAIGKKLRTRKWCRNGHNPVPLDIFL